MPPIAVHFALGALAAYFIVRKLPRERDRGPAALGIITGVVMVDADLLVSGVASLFAGTEDVGELIHRTFTHSIALVTILAVAGAIAIRRNRAWGMGLLFASGGIAFLHILPDLFYLTEVKLLFPFSLFGYHFGEFHNDALTAGQKNAITGLDFLSESFIWLFVWWLAREYGTENRFTRLLPAFAFVNAWLYAILIFYYAPIMPYEGGGAFKNFLWIAYTPGQLNILVSTILIPILARETFLRFGSGGGKAQGRAAA